MNATRSKRQRLTDELHGIGDDHQRLAEAGARLAEVEADLEATEERWLELADDLEKPRAHAVSDRIRRPWNTGRGWGVESFDGTV